MFVVNLPANRSLCPPPRTQHSNTRIHLTQWPIPTYKGSRKDKDHWPLLGATRVTTERDTLMLGSVSVVLKRWYGRQFSRPRTMFYTSWSSRLWWPLYPGASKWLLAGWMLDHCMPRPSGARFTPCAVLLTGWFTIHLSCAESSRYEGFVVYIPSLVLLPFTSYNFATIALSALFICGPGNRAVCVVDLLCFAGREFAPCNL